MSPIQDSLTALAVPYVLEEGEGEQINWLGGAVTVKASGPDFDVALATEVAGSEPSAHAHPYNDEAIHVLEGALTVFVGDEVLAAPTGSFVFVPRGVPHTFSVESSSARLLFILSPSGAFSACADAERRFGHTITPERRTTDEPFAAPFARSRDRVAGAPCRTRRHELCGGFLAEGQRRHHADP